MGNWVVVSKSQNSITWSLNLVNKTNNTPKCLSVTIVLPASTANTYWSLFPNHSTGVPVLLKLVSPGIQTRWYNGNWLSYQGGAEVATPC